MSDETERQYPNDDCLLWSYRLDGSGGGRHQGRFGDGKQGEPGFDWFHVRSDDPAAADWMREMKLDPHVVEALSAIETRPRMARLAGGILINLRGVNRNPGADPEDMIAIRVWFNREMIVTGRRRQRRLLSVEDVRALIDDSRGPRSTGEFLAFLLENLAGRIGDVVDTIDEDLSAIESQLDDDSLQTAVHDLLSVRRQIAAIRRYLAPQREALSELCRSRNDLIEPDVVLDLQNQTDRIMHYVEDLDLARERTLMLQGDLQNRLAEQQNARMYLLSIVAAIFLPLSFLTGVFGMNVAGLSGVEDPDAFFVLAVSMVALAVALIVYMRWKKWL